MKILNSFFFNVFASILLLLFLSCKANNVDKTNTDTCLLEKFTNVNGAETFGYDSENRLTKHDVFDRNLILSLYYLYDYDSDGKVIKETIIYSNDANNPYITEFKYNAKGLLIAIGTNCINLFYDQNDKLNYVTYNGGGTEYYSNDELIKTVNKNNITNFITTSKVGNYDVVTITSKDYLAKYYYFDGNLFKEDYANGSYTSHADYVYDAYNRPTIPSCSKKGWPVCFLKHYPPLNTSSKGGTFCSSNPYGDLKNSKNNLLTQTINGKPYLSYTYEYNANNFPTVEIGAYAYNAPVTEIPNKYFYKNCK